MIWVSKEREPFFNGLCQQALGLKMLLRIVLLRGCEIVSKLGFSIMRGPLEGGGGEGLTGGVFSGEGSSSFFSCVLSYV